MTAALLGRVALSRGALAVYLSIYETAWHLSWSLTKGFSVPLEISLLLDVYSCLFLARVCLISGRVILFSYAYMSQETFFLRFHLLVLSFVLSI